jgi:hypothetical protein
VRDIYQETNRKLIERKVLPTIRVGLKRQGSAAPGAPARVGVAELGGSVVPADGGDLFAVLQQLMVGAGGAVQPISLQSGSGQSFIPGPLLPGEVAGNDPCVALQPGTFLHALNQLQHGHAEGVAMAGIDAGALGSGQVNVLRDLRSGGMAGMMNSLDAMTLDIVAMVFDYILGDDRIPDAIKALIGRLQIPMLKVAMLDKRFFSQKNHPARRLLDGLAEAAIGWDPGEGHEGGLYRKIEQLVSGVLARFEDDLAIFESALAELQAFLDEERQAAHRLAALSALAVQTREQAENGRQAAHDEIESCLLGRPVPGAIRAFLNEHWSRLLAGLHAKVGTDSETWSGAVATMKDLVWSVAPKVDASERKGLVERLPGLLKRLDEGVDYLGLPEAARNAFFASLVKCHADAVKASMHEEDAGTIEDAEAAAGYDQIPVLEEPAGFEPVEPVAEASVPALPEAPVGEVVEEITLTALDWAEDDLPMAAADNTLAGLRRGSWIAYRLDDGVEVRAKLSWVSPRKGIYLFTNRQGQRAMSINADGLKCKLNSGEVRLLDAAPLMDRAVDNLMAQLKRNAA